MFIGNIIAFSGINTPEGYLECDGSAVSRVDYSDLFSVIGTSYGAGDGSNTFNLPNLNGKVALGISQNRIIGSNGGEEFHSLIEAETPYHTHEIPEHTHGNDIVVTTPSLTHTVTQPMVQYTKLNSMGTYPNIGTSGSPNNYVSTKAGTMSRTTDLAIADHPATQCTVTGGILDCPTFNTESTGGGVAHNNMMPYLAVKYLIKAYIPVPIEPGMALFNGCCVVSAGGGYITGKTV